MKISTQWFSPFVIANKSLRTELLKFSETNSNANDETLLKAVCAKLDLLRENDQLKNTLATLQNEKLLKDAALFINQINDNGFLTRDEEKKYIILAAKEPETVRTILMNRKSQQQKQEQLLKLSGKQLYLNGQFEQLKTISLAHFKTKYKEFFGVEYQPQV